MNKTAQKGKRRFLMWILLLTVILLYLSFFIYNYWSRILDNNKMRDDLTSAYNDSLANEEQLNSELNKLQDPEYVAKFAREKYMYSKDGEMIIRITED